MYTLAIILFILNLFSYYKINKKCKEKNIKFNPFEAGFMYCILFIFGLANTIMTFLYLCLTNLP